MTARLPWGWSSDGLRAPRRDFFVRGKKHSDKWYRHTILPVISLNGIIVVGVYTDALTVEKFNEFIYWIV